MARPEKTGVDYFPLDIHMNDRIKLVEAKFGLIGFAVIVKLWAKIYGSGYYCEWNDDVALLFAGENKTSDNVVNEIMNEAVGRGIFDKRLYEKYGILTSKGIQKRYLMMTSRRKAVDLNSEYLLVDVPPNAVNVYINGINVNNNSINDDKSTQSKVNKSKLNKNKLNAASAERAAQPNYNNNSYVKKSKFNNYEDTNKIDYKALEERLLDMMLEED